MVVLVVGIGRDLGDVGPHPFAYGRATDGLLVGVCAQAGDCPISLISSEVMYGEVTRVSF